LPTSGRTLLLITVLALGVGACHRQVTTLESAPIAVAPVRSTPEAIARARADSARLPWTTADASFMTGMIGHHAQAIVMARMAPTNGASPSIRTLAARIINAQGDEIHLMRQWLSDRQLPIPDADPRGMRHKVGGDEHLMLMPGMLTESQMLELANSRGPAFDRRFLELMIQHHRGATEMVKTLFATDGAGQNQTVFKLASDVNVDQNTEIARMELMLSRMPAPQAGRS
jgi:uncharacterized protein (DUF305 family)